MDIAGSPATLGIVEILLLMAVMPLLLIAPIAEAWERLCERRRASAEAREQALAWQRTWMRLYGPVEGPSAAAVDRRVQGEPPASRSSSITK